MAVDGVQVKFLGFVRGFKNKNAVVDCVEATELWGCDVFGYKDIMEKVGATPGDRLRFGIHINPKGIPQVSPPCWQVDDDDQPISAVLGAAEVPEYVKAEELDADQRKQLKHAIEDRGAVARAKKLGAGAAAGGAMPGVLPKASGPPRVVPRRTSAPGPAAPIKAKVAPMPQAMKLLRPNRPAAAGVEPPPQIKEEMAEEQPEGEDVPMPPDVDMAMLEMLMAKAKSEPLASEYDSHEVLVFCDLPDDEMLELIAGKEKECLDEVAQRTGATVILEKQDGDEYQTLRLHGHLLAVISAHALVMARYHEAQSMLGDEEEPVMKEEEADVDMAPADTPEGALEQHSYEADALAGGPPEEGAAVAEAAADAAADADAAAAFAAAGSGAGPRVLPWFKPQGLSEQGVKEEPWPQPDIVQLQHQVRELKLKVKLAIAKAKAAKGGVAGKGGAGRKAKGGGAGKGGRGLPQRVPPRR